MKQVITETQQITIFTKNISTSKYYVIKDNNGKSPITKDLYNNSFIALVDDNFTEGNRYNFTSNDSSLEKFIEEAIRLDWKVYEFDTAKEMYKYLAE